MAYAAVRCTIRAAVPNCEGYARPVRVVAPLGTIVNPRPPAACAARGVMAYRMLDVLFAAFAKIVPARMPAAGEGGPSAISLSGTHDGKAWLITDGILGSWGGRAAKDGIDGISNPGANFSNMPVELVEARYPLRIEDYGLVPNSGGAGRHRGGMALARSYRILAEHAALTVRSDRRLHLPPGLFGGCPGSPSLNILEQNGERTLLPVMPMRTLALSKGDLFIHVAPGAAGNGDPLERDPDTVAEDVLDGRFTEAFARQVYGVVIGPDGRPDHAATGVCRDRLTADRSGLERDQRRLFMEGDRSRALLGAERTGASS